MIIKSGLLKSEKGVAMVFSVLSLTVILGFCALAIDIGVAVDEKARISHAVDAAALAGASEFIDNPENAEEIAAEYLEKNGVDPLDAEIVVYDSNTKIKVTAKKSIKYFFAGVLGFDTGEVSSTAVAECAPISEVSEDIKPFAIEDQCLVFGQDYVLKEGGGDGSDGNYGALSLDGSGARNYIGNIVNGYDGNMEVGDLVCTEPGNMSGPTLEGITTLIDQCERIPECTYDNYEPNCPKLITVVIVDSLDVNGRSNVTITGFAKFFLEGVQGVGNESIVTGRFVKTAAVGEISTTATDYGMKGIKLIQ